MGGVGGVSTAGFAAVVGAVTAAGTEIVDNILHLQNTINDDTNKVVDTINYGDTQIVNAINNLRTSENTNKLVDTINNGDTQIVNSINNLRTSVIGESSNTITAIDAVRTSVIDQSQRTIDAINGLRSSVVGEGEGIISTIKSSATETLNSLNNIRDIIVNLSKNVMLCQYNLPIASGVTVFYTVATGNSVPLSTASFIFTSDARLVNALAMYDTGYFVRMQGTNRTIAFAQADGTTTINHAIGPLPIRVKFKAAGLSDRVIDILYYTMP